MLITIHNLPSNTQYIDIKFLILSKCGLKDVIMDQLVPEENGKKVTVGVADEGDAAMLVRNLNGFYLQDSQLFVEVVRHRRPEDQPYRNPVTKKRNEHTSNLQNNQPKSTALSSGMPQTYQNMHVHQMPMSQMGTAQMGPPQMRMERIGSSQMGSAHMSSPQMVPRPSMMNYESKSNIGSNYDTLQNSQTGFGMQQQYYSTIMVPPTISYPMKQTTNLGFGMANNQSSSQDSDMSWGNYNSSEKRNVAFYSNKSQSEFNHTATRSRNEVVTTKSYVSDREQNVKRKRSESPGNRQSYPPQSRFKWTNTNDNNSGRQDSNKNDYSRSSNYNFYGSHATSSSTRDENLEMKKNCRWERPSTQLSYSNQIVSQNSKRSRSRNRSTVKRFRGNENDKMSTIAPNRKVNQTAKQTTANSITKNTSYGGTLPSHRIDFDNKRTIHQAAKKIAKETITNVDKSPDATIPKETIINATLDAVKARMIEVTSGIRNIRPYDCTKNYRDRYPGSDDQDFYNEIINLCICKHRAKTLKEAQVKTGAVSNLKPILPTEDKKSIPQVCDRGVASEKRQAEPSIFKPRTTQQEIKLPTTNIAPPATKPKNVNVQIPAPGTLLKYPHGNKQLNKENKRENKLQFAQGPKSITGNPIIKNAVEKEMADIDKLMFEEVKNSLTAASPEEKIFYDYIDKRGVARKINEALQLNVLRRLIDTSVKPVVRISGNPKPPNKTVLMNYLKNYGILNLKRCDRSPCFVATCDSYETFDSLIQLNAVDMEGRTVTFRPLHLGGPPDKKAMREDRKSSKLGNKLKNINRLQPKKKENTVTKKKTSQGANTDSKVTPNIPDTDISQTVNELNKGQQVEVKKESDVIIFKSEMGIESDWPEGDTTEWIEEKPVNNIKENYTSQEKELEINVQCSTKERHDEGKIESSKKDTNKENINETSTKENTEGNEIESSVQENNNINNITESNAKEYLEGSEVESSRTENNVENIAMTGTIEHSAEIEFNSATKEDNIDKEIVRSAKENKEEKIAAISTEDHSKEEEVADATDKNKDEKEIESYTEKNKEVKITIELNEELDSVALVANDENIEHVGDYKVIDANDINMDDLDDDDLEDY